MNLKAFVLNQDKTQPLFNTPECQQLLEMYDKVYNEKTYSPPWIGYLIIENNQVLGTCGFASTPKEGQVEIAYWTFPAFEGKGVASFACSELIQIAQKEDSTILITAKTAPEHNASSHILKKNGFMFSKIVQDHEIGDAWLWVLKK